MRILPLLAIITTVYSGNLIANPGDDTDPNGNKLPPGYITCPKISDLSKDDQMIWHGKGGWHSYASSFANRADKFLGAQWVGVKLGTLFCLYKGDLQTFTIDLQYPGMAQSPEYKKWSKDLGGYKNCVSSNLEDCAFKPEKKESKGTLYQQLDSIKPP